MDEIAEETGAEGGVLVIEEKDHQEEEEEMELSYNEIRERNIARNEEFLNYLFPDGISSKENEGHSKKEISDQFPSSSSNINIQDLCQRIQHKLPSRSNEMLRIFEYLEQVSASDLVVHHWTLQTNKRTPALLIYGPAGVGYVDGPTALLDIV